MHKKVFTVELGTDSPNNIDAAEVHLALIRYFVAFVSIDVTEAAQHSVQRTLRKFPANHKDEPFCECSVCMGFVKLPQSR